MCKLPSLRILTATRLDQIPPRSSLGRQFRHFSTFCREAREEAWRCIRRAFKVKVEDGKERGEIYVNPVSDLSVDFRFTGVGKFGAVRTLSLSYSASDNRPCSTWFVSVPLPVYQSFDPAPNFSWSYLVSDKISNCRTSFLTLTLTSFALLGRRYSYSQNSKLYDCLQTMIPLPYQLWRKVFTTLKTTHLPLWRNQAQNYQSPSSQYHRISRYIHTSSWSWRYLRHRSSNDENWPWNNTGGCGNLGKNNKNVCLIGSICVRGWEVANWDIIWGVCWRSWRIVGLCLDSPTGFWLEGRIGTKPLWLSFNDQNHLRDCTLVR